MKSSTPNSTNARRPSSLRLGGPHGDHRHQHGRARVDILLGGNPEGLARDELRKQGHDLTEIDPALWESTLRKWSELVAKDKQKVVELGGLHVIGTERHEARRIDNQLRGRAGRQGDPGSSRFYVSLQDD